MNGLDLSALDQELALRVVATQKALVQVRTGSHGSGSGVVLHGDGLIVTNAHVTRRRGARVVLANGEEARARLLAYDEGLDLAALAVDTGNGGRQLLPSIALGDSCALKPGALVVAVGHPWGVVGAATAGMVIGVGRPLERVPYAGDLIQVGLQLRPGHSGGPMINSAGEVIGINTMIAGPLVGFAIPAATVSRFLKENLSRRERRPKRERQPSPMPV